MTYCRLWLSAMWAAGRAGRVAAHPVAVAAVLRAAPASPVSAAGVDVRPTAGGVSAETDRPPRIGQLVEQVESDPARRCTSVKGDDLPCRTVIEGHERAVLQGVADRSLQRSQPGEVDVDEVRGQRLAQREERCVYVDPLEVVGLPLRDHARALAPDQAVSPVGEVVFDPREVAAPAHRVHEVEAGTPTDESERRDAGTQDGHTPTLMVLRLQDH
jgi:hypothetical protein